MQVTDAMESQIGNIDFYGFHFAGTRCDCGDVGGYLAANLVYAMERPELADNLRAVAAKHTHA